MSSTKVNGWHIVRLDGVAATAWRNGGGTTRELLAWPTPDAWTVRLSVAEVSASGPFSQFDGVTRWFAVLSGDGVRLRLGNDVTELTPASAPFMFDGAVPVHCDLLGKATQDLNLMLRGLSGSMVRVSGSHRCTARAGALIALYAQRDSTIMLGGEERLEIPAQALAWRILESDAPVLAAGADMLWMEVAS